MATIPTQVIQLAIRRIREQGPTPKSPCEITSAGVIRLCAAAAVAASGIEVADGTAARNRFENELAKCGDFDLVRKTYQRFDWDTNECELKLTFNDSQRDSKRQDNVLSMLTSWPS